ncbi:MAG: helix-turn-helix transcriptional regulator [Acidobacteria bacterium]|nr:helix-turn-helix transcriptional regulator [Acidobacteriota bacterium]
MTKIGESIKELRSNLGISQEPLAHMAGLDRTYVNSVENGKRNTIKVGVE